MDCVLDVALQIIRWGYIHKWGFLEVRDNRCRLRSLSSHLSSNSRDSSNIYQANAKEATGTTSIGLPKRWGKGSSRMQTWSGLRLDNKGGTCFLRGCCRYYFNWFCTCIYIILLLCIRLLHVICINHSAYHTIYYLRLGVGY